MAQSVKLEYRPSRTPSRGKYEIGWQDSEGFHVTGYAETAWRAKNIVRKNILPEGVYDQVDSSDMTKMAPRYDREWD